MLNFKSHSFFRTPDAMSTTWQANYRSPKCENPGSIVGKGFCDGDGCC